MTLTEKNNSDQGHDMGKPKDGFADAGALVTGAMRALRPDADPYTAVQLAIDKAIGSTNPSEVAAIVREAQLRLASIAASPSFDMRRHRAISSALRAVAAEPHPAPLAPLTTRGAR